MNDDQVRIVRLPSGAELSCTVDGPPGAPSILLNRPLGGSMALWGTFAKVLSESLRVVAFDPRGVGRSSPVPLRFNGFGTRDMARDAISLLDELALARVHVFGISLGGMVASWIAAEAPLRTLSLVLASTLPKLSTSSHHALSRALPMTRALMSSRANAEIRLVRAVLSSAFRERCPERVREIEDTVRRNPARHRDLIALALATARHRMPESLAVRAPRTCCLIGSNDPLVGRASEAELLHDIDGAELRRIPDSGHDLTLEQPEQTARAVLDFVGRS
jgi:3-oxoadipate enol-lactonase